MNILGLHIGHNASACVVKDGKLVSAISTERISRKKKHELLKEETIRYALKEANLELEDIDAVTLSDYSYDLARHIFTIKNPESDMNISSTHQTLFGNELVKTEGTLLGKNVNVYVVPHHTSHCASAYYTSDFDKAFCFSMDSSGGNVKANSLIAIGDGNKLEAIECPGIMSGWAYGFFTEVLGLGKMLEKAGSMMGLASYGQPLQEVKDNIDKYVLNSFFYENTKYAEYKAFYKDLFIHLNSMIKHNQVPSQNGQITIAATVQLIFEESILKLLKEKNYDESVNLCLSGGSFLNCNVNSRIKNETKYKNIHHYPACTDDGVAVGSALYIAHNIFEEPRHKYTPKEIAYTGHKYKYTEPNYEEVAQLIAEGKIVGWFMGGSEYGPRALGNRSILADPRNFHNREIINFIIKKREWFRPLAPSILEEECYKWFEFDGVSPYMLYTAKVLQPDLIPAVTHIDGTARMQTVNEEMNAPYYKLIKEFYKITGVPMVLNTSLNGSNEPILETEEDAMKFYEKNDIDAMVINGKLYKKEK